MQPLIKILLIVLELIQSLLAKQKADKHNAEIEQIRDEPADRFIDEFGGLPSGSEKAGMSGGKAGVEVGHKE